MCIPLSPPWVPIRRLQRGPRGRGFLLGGEGAQGLLPESQALGCQGICPPLSLNAKPHSLSCQNHLRDLGESTIVNPRILSGERRFIWSWVPPRSPLPRRRGVPNFPRRDLVAILNPLKPKPHKPYAPKRDLDFLRRP